MIKLFKKKNDKPIGTQVMINIKDIIVPSKFRNSPPSVWKLNLITEHCKELGRLDYPIIVHTEAGIDKYYIKDNYVRYIVARDTFNLREIPCMIVNNHWLKIN